MEKTITSVLEDIQARLPSFDVFKQCYTADSRQKRSLQSKIRLAHIAIVNFAVDTIAYYLQPGYRELHIEFLGPATRILSIARAVDDRRFSTDQIRGRDTSGSW